MPNQSSGLVAGNQQNEAGGATIRNRSRFPLSMSFFNTERFAEYVPFMVAEAVPNDKFTFNSSHDERTYTMKAPLMQSLLKKKDYFWVPMQAILPLNWEKFFTNPVIGQDVPDDVGTGVNEFWNKIENIFFNSWTYLGSSLQSSLQVPNLTADNVRDLIRFIVFFEYLYSCGSLMKCLNISGSAYCHIVRGSTIVTFDDFFDAVINTLVANLDNITCSIGGTLYRVRFSGDLNDDYLSPYSEITVREFLEIVRDELATFSVNTVTVASGSTVGTAIQDIVDIFDDFVITRVLNNSSGTTVYPVHLNLARLWAYQLVCHHYYSNDHVDFIYSAELYRQYIHQLVTGTGNSTIGTGSASTADFAFVVNGLQYIYDALSAKYFAVLSGLLTGSSGIFAISASNPGYYPNLADVYGYFTALFHYKRSLRFMDYFSGSRTYPLAAVNDLSVSAAGGTVSILDLAERRMMSKFLQAVNRTGRKIGAYVAELFGIVPKPDYHNPLYLAHTSDVVGNAEVENTAQAQQELANSVTSTMKSNASRYAFEFTPDRNCIVIGIQYYDIPRVYSKATERQNFFLDRFDMFNPYMQYIGDQEIYKAELGLNLPSLDPFSYTNRHMEYKQRFNQCAGGFAVPSTGLHNWLFIADNHRRRYVQNLSPSFIRSFNSEFDDFYVSLTGWSNGTYFHFITRYDNRLDASRPMAYAPSLT